MKGIGVYIRRLGKSRHGTPKQAAKRAADHGVSFVAVLGAWQQPGKDGFGNGGWPIPHPSSSSTGSSPSHNAAKRRRDSRSNPIPSLVTAK